MPDIIFSHPFISKITSDGRKLDSPLVLPNGANSITWSYGLNTQTIPTYGGEVVQLLSIYMEDIFITGHIREYSTMERFYEWFIAVMQFMTQGQGGPRAYQNFDEEGAYGQAYNQTPVTLTYPERGWVFKILPKALPGFKYGTDVVVPEYQLQAAIVQADKEVYFLTEAEAEAILHKTDLKTDTVVFGSSTKEIGFQEENKFSAPYAGPFDAKATRKLLQVDVDYFRSLIPEYLTFPNNKFPTLSADFSKPAAVGGGGQTTSTKTKKK